MNDKRNPNFIKGDGESSRSHRDRLTEYISKLEWQSEGHRQWYTHKNPYGCWICELLQITRELEANYLVEPGDDERGVRGDQTDESEP